MEGFIEVYDNLVPSYLQSQLESLILGKNPPNHFPLFSSYNLSQGKNADIGFHNNFSINSDYRYAILQPLYILGLYKKFVLKNIFINRVFLQPISNNLQIPTPHVDMVNNLGETIPHLVCLYYVNDSDGDTIFYNKDGSIRKKQSPKKGTIVFFDGSIKHSAGIPTINERIVINICFEAETLNIN